MESRTDPIVDRDPGDEQPERRHWSGLPWYDYQGLFKEWKPKPPVKIKYAHKVRTRDGYMIHYGIE